MDDSTEERMARSAINPGHLGRHRGTSGNSIALTAQRVGYRWELVEKFSSFSSLINATALCFRFIARCRNDIVRARGSPITSKETEAAREYWVMETQAAYFAYELKCLHSQVKLPAAHGFSKLTAFIDNKGILRVGGRLENSGLSYEGKNPIILPRHSPLIELIVRQAHLATLHGGTQLTVAQFRTQYCVIGGRAPVKTIILRCVVCARQRGIRAHELMGQLPLSWVTQLRRFHYTGTDYASPISLRTWKGRRAKIQKGWICVFVCLTTSALHLELVSDYSSDGFIAAYRRFTARRGIPHSIHSDCGTNFVGAEKSSLAMFTQGTHEYSQLAHLFLTDKASWHLNPPAAPYVGGKWEAALNSVKHHLRRSLGEIVLTFEEYSSLLTQIAVILNSRPMEAFSDDPEDVAPLTPAHFLVGQLLTTLPEPSTPHSSLTRSLRWQLIKHQVQWFSVQWSSRYLQQQLSQSKWHHPRNEIKVGSLVLITDERLPQAK